MTKTMTIDELAVMMNNAFTRQQEWLNEQFEKRDKRFDTFESGQERFAKADVQAEQGATLKRLEERTESMESKLDATVGLTDNHDRRIKRLEQHAGLAPLPAK